MFLQWFLNDFLNWWFQFSFVFFLSCFLAKYPKLWKYVLFFLSPVFQLRISLGIWLVVLEFHILFFYLKYHLAGLTALSVDISLSTSFCLIIEYGKLRIFYVRQSWCIKFIDIKFHSIHSLRAQVLFGSGSFKFNIGSVLISESVGSSIGKIIN